MKLRTILVMTLVVLLIQLVSTLETNLSVPENNFPPFQLQNIPDQSWPMNRNITDSFDLDDYFIDYEDFIIYNFTSVGNITIVINETTNVVSFFSDINFTGERNVTFIVSDGFAETWSNLVRINVTNDNSPPNWYDINITPVNISQNTLVTFSANWTDNIGLSYFIFSINQGTGWVNYTQSFSGRSNISSYALSISAPGETNVLWRFYAYDTSNNFNETTIQYFTVNIKPSNQQEEDDDTSSTTKKTAKGGQAQKTYPTKSILKGFEVIPDNLAVELKQGESITKLLKINNLGLRETNFSLKIEGLEEFLIIDKNNFSIKSSESAILALLFKTNRKSVPDIYFGKLIITTLTERIDVPIVLTVNPLILEFEIEIKLDEKYKIVNLGEEIEGRITLINKKDLLYENITVYYSLMDFFGEVINYGEEEINLSENIIRFNRNMTIPLNSNPGDYIYYVRATKDNKVSMDLEEFIVGEKFNLFSFVIGNIIYLIIALIFIITLLLFVYYHKTKEKERLLSLYIMINELKRLIEENKMEEAIMQYNRIKLTYHERIDKMEEQNKEEIKKEMQELILSFNELNNVKKLKAEIDNSKNANNPKVEKTVDENEQKIEEKNKEEIIIDTNKKDKKKAVKKNAKKK